MPTMPVSAWSLDETSGDRADAVGSNTLGDGNTATYGTGIVANAARFEWSNGEYLYISDASQSGLDITGDLSFMCWVCFDDSNSNSDHIIFSKWTSGNRSYWFSYNPQAGFFRFQVTSNGSTAQGDTISYSLTTGLGTWYHIALIYDASAGSAELFIDGSSVGTFTGLATSIYSGSADFCLSARAGGSNNWDGYIDEAYIFNVAIDSADIAAHYNGGSGADYATYIGGGSSEISPYGSFSRFYSEKVSLVQHNSLSVKDSYSSLYSQEIFLTQHSDIIVRGSYSSLFSQKLSLTQHSGISVRGSYSPLASQKVLLTQHNAVAVSGSYSSVYSQKVAIAQHSAITVRGSYSSLYSQGVSLTQHNSLTVKGSYSSLFSQKLSLTQHNALSVYGSYISSISQIVSIGGAKDSYISIASEKVSLTQHNSLAVSGSYSPVVSGNIVLTQHNSIIVLGSYVSSLSEKVILTQHSNIEVMSTYHGHYVERVSISQQNNSSAYDSYSSIISEKVSLVQHHSLSVRGSIVDSYAEKISLTQHHALTVKGSYIPFVVAPQSIGTQLTVYGSYVGAVAEKIIPYIDIEIEISSTGYCGIDCVRKMTPLRKYTTQTKPTKAQVLSYITSYYYQINSMLDVLGYVTPIASGNSTAISIVGRLNCLGAASLAEEAAYSANKEASEYAKELYDVFKMNWEDLEKGYKNLLGVERVSPYIKRANEKHPSGSFRVTKGKEQDPNATIDMDL